MREGDGSNIDVDPALIPLQAAAAASQAALFPRVIPPAGIVHSIDGMLGPDILFNTAAPVNGIAVTKSSVGNTTTFGISGPGTMAQRNAVAAVADIATADAVDLATAITLVNVCKAKINELLAAMRTANHLL